MSTYLQDHRPARSQYRSPRRTRPTGCTVLHTAESLLDSVGPDTGAEAVAAFISRRADPGSYHDLCDSDSALQLVPYGDEAYHDGTGSNPWSLSISWALAAADWPRLSVERRDAFLRQGVVAFRRQQAWLKANGYPLTPLRRITKADSDRGVAGFIKHGERDPGRRSDPGDGFPWTRWFELCAEKTPTGSSTRPPAPIPTEMDDAMLINKVDPTTGAVLATALVGPNKFRILGSASRVRFWEVEAKLGKPLDVSPARWDEVRDDALNNSTEG